MAIRKAVDVLALILPLTLVVLFVMVLKAAPAVKPARDSAAAQETQPSARRSPARRDRRDRTVRSVQR